MNAMIRRIAGVIARETSSREGIEPVAAAIAVIRAMREPTKEMIETAKENADLGGYGFNDECFPGDPVDVWEKMIDGALK